MNVKEKVKSFFGNFGSILKNIVLLIIIFICVFYVWRWYKDKYTNNDWTLIVSSSETPNVDNNIKWLDGIKSKDSCYQLAPLHTPIGGSWECVRGDLYDKYKFQVWKEVCTVKGCRE